MVNVLPHGMITLINVYVICKVLWENSCFSFSISSLIIFAEGALVDLISWAIENLYDDKIREDVIGSVLRLGLDKFVFI